MRMYRSFEAEKHLRPALAAGCLCFVLLGACIGVRASRADFLSSFIIGFLPGELVATGHRFFGGVSRGLATIIEKAVSQWGLPNGYVLGQEAGGAFVVGLRYGEGVLYTKNAGDLKVFWQGPTLGWDVGGEGARTMMLVYNLPATDAIYQYFAGVDGSAYFVGGFGMTVLTANRIVVVPIRSGVGVRLGANVGYLKFTHRATWNPF